MFVDNGIRFEEARVERVPGQWSTMSPSEFQTIPLPERVQLLLKKRIKFFAKGIEVKALDALMD
jgi:hypothetical protein